MSIALVLLGLLRASLSDSVSGRSNAKVVEDYVLSANFDSAPQIASKGRYDRKGAWEDAERKVMEGYYYGDPSSHYDGPEDALKERDLVLAAPGHRPHPPASVSPHSIFAIGFMSFLMLLSSLQISMMIAKPKAGGLLGGLLGGGAPAGRRRRKRYAPQYVVHYAGKRDARRPRRTNHGTV